jgi:hypothetical protein
VAAGDRAVAQSMVAVWVSRVPGSVNDAATSTAVTSVMVRSGPASTVGARLVTVTRAVASSLLPSSPVTRTAMV